MSYRVLVAVLSIVLGLACSGGFHPTTAQSAPDAAVIEDSSRLPVVIGGRDYALDALIVRRPGTDKLPVALITHGANPGDPRAATTEWLRGWAHDLANRGWLAVAVKRRGYGNSDGDIADDAGTCSQS